MYYDISLAQQMYRDRRTQITAWRENTQADKEKLRTLFDKFTSWFDRRFRGINSIGATRAVVDTFTRRLIN